MDSLSLPCRTPPFPTTCLVLSRRSRMTRHFGYGPQVPFEEVVDPLGRLVLAFVDVARR
jgi:hypothetical protein